MSEVCYNNVFAYVGPCPDVAVGVHVGSNVDSVVVAQVFRLCAAVSQNLDMYIPIIVLSLLECSFKSAFYSFEHVHQRGLAEPLATMHSSVEPHARQVGPIPVDLKH